VKSHGASEVSVSHASYDAPAVGEARGIPPSVLKRFDHRARITVRVFEESGDANQTIGLNKSRATATSQSRGASGVNHETGGENDAAGKGQPPFIVRALGIANSSIENESRAQAFGFSGEHGVERSAVDVPAGTARHVNEVVVQGRSAAPGRGRAVDLPVVLFLESLPHAEVLEDRPDRRR
jgi:hypothetical protein